MYLGSFYFCRSGSLNSFVQQENAQTTLLFGETADDQAAPPPPVLVVFRKFSVTGIRDSRCGSWWMSRRLSWALIYLYIYVQHILCVHVRCMFAFELVAITNCNYESSFIPSSQPASQIKYLAVSLLLLASFFFCTRLFPPPFLIQNLFLYVWWLSL